MDEYIVVTLGNTLWKNPQWVAQVHAGHIGDKIVKEISGSIHNVPSGHLAGHIVIAFSMCPAITLRSKWWAHWESILNEWLRLHAGHIVSHIIKETPGFFHKVPAGHIEAILWKKSLGSFKKYPLVTLVDTFWM